MSINSSNRVLFFLRGACSRHRYFCSSSVTTSESRLINEAVGKKRDALFTAEKERQAALIARVEKIEVRYLGPMEDCTLIMNKGISTPHDCAKHIHESLVQRAAIAEVDGEPWDMSRPLVQDCQLRLNFYKDSNPYFANKAFWRTGSFLLGYIVERAFKDQFYVQLHSWPQPQVRSGSFVYNVDLGIENWEPRRDELDVLSGMGRRLAIKPHHFERLEVDASVALQMFEDNKYKAEQIPRIAAASPSGNTVTLYRLLDHVDISSGPMIGSLDHMGRFKVISVHAMDTSVGLLYRFQGLAIPTSFSISEFAYSICCERAQRMNYTGLPQSETEAGEEPTEDNVHFKDMSAEDEHAKSETTSDDVTAATKDSATATSQRTSA
uniref:Large ribosomal subunit protein mL39 n=1 Tax=Amblyomma aureolatum TaxID=187763 RepID=A0A1E1X8C2_9ACAR